MKRLAILLLSIAAMMTGMALAQKAFGIPYIDNSIEFIDTDFDYEAEDYGYIHLSREGDRVNLTFNREAEGGIKLEYDEITELDEDRLEDGDYTQIFLDNYYRTAAGIDIGTRGVDLAFQDADMNRVMDYFIGSMGINNFTPVEVVGTANTYAFDCGCNVDSAYHVRVTFTQLGTTVYVHLSIV